MESLLPKPREIYFNAPNLQLHGKDRRRKIQCAVFLFLIAELGRDVFNTMAWGKKRNSECNRTDEDGVMVGQLFKLKDYWLPKKNLVVERKKFLCKNQNDDEIFDQYMIELKNLASKCDF